MVSERARLFRPVLAYALVMLIVFLGVGVLYREFSKAFLGGGAEDVVPAFYLSLSHGHALLMGALIPMALLFAVIVAEQLGARDIDYAGLRKAFIMYAIGSLAAIGLLIYKGLGIIYNYSALGSMELADQALFLGSHALRESLYGTAHLIMGVGLVWYVAKVLAILKKVQSK